MHSDPAPRAPRALLAGALLAGCATSPINGITRAAAVTPAAAPDSCRFQVVDLQDLRPDKKLGEFGLRVIEGPEFTAWFQDGLARMPGYSGDAAAVRIHVELLNAYIQAMGTSKVVNIVARARIEAGERPVVVHNYRGVDSSVNWVNGEGEMQDAFDRALVELTRQLQVDIGSTCHARAGDGAATAAASPAARGQAA